MDRSSLTAVPVPVPVPAPAPDRYIPAPGVWVAQPVPTGTGAGAGTAWYTAPRQEPPDDGDARPGTDRHLSEDWTAGVLDGPIHTAIDT